MRRTRTLNQFIASIENGATSGAFDGDTITEFGITSALERIQSAIPIARSLILFGHPLSPEHRPLHTYLDEIEAAIDAEADDPTDPDHECEKMAASREALFYVGLVAGLMIADQY